MYIYKRDYAGDLIQLSVVKVDNQNKWEIHTHNDAIFKSTVNNT